MSRPRAASSDRTNYPRTLPSVSWISQAVINCAVIDGPSLDGPGWYVWNQQHTDVVAGPFVTQAEANEMDQDMTT